jgi:hypothetical protein
MTSRFLRRNVGAVIIAAGLLGGVAHAQTMIYQTGPNSAFITTPGQPTVGAYVTHGQDPRSTYYTVPGQQQPFQANPAQQNWQQYVPGRGYNR